MCTCCVFFVFGVSCLSSCVVTVGVGGGASAEEEGWLMCSFYLTLFPLNVTH